MARKISVHLVSALSSRLPSRRNRRAPSTRKKLKLVSLTPEQENSRQVKYVFDNLPTTRDSLDALFSTDLACEEYALIGLQRLRDYYNPALLPQQDEDAAEGEDPAAAASSGDKKWDKTQQKQAEDFARFTHCLLLKWLDLSESSVETKEQEGVLRSVQLHLKELSSDPLVSPTIVAYLSSQMESLTSLLQSLRELEEEARDAEALS